MTTIDTISLARKGVSLILDGSKYTTIDLLSIAKIIAETKAHLTIRNASLKHTTIDLISLAKIAPNNITIEL